MCRKNTLAGCCLMALGLGVLLGFCLNSWFWCACCSLSLLGLGFLFLQKKLWF